MNAKSSDPVLGEHTFVQTLELLPVLTEIEGYADSSRPDDLSGSVTRPDIVVASRQVAFTS